MSICSTGLSNEERKIVGALNPSDLDDVTPLAVKPKVAWRLLSCSNTYGYELLAAGELDSYLDGKARKITMASIQSYIARRIEAAKRQKAAA